MTTSLTLAQAILTLHLKKEKKKQLIIHYFNFVAFYRAKPQPRCTEHRSHWEFFSLFPFISITLTGLSEHSAFFLLPSFKQGNLNEGSSLVHLYPVYKQNKMKYNRARTNQRNIHNAKILFFPLFFLKVYFSVFFRGRELIQHCISSQKVVSINRSHQYVQY